MIIHLSMKSKEYISLYEALLDIKDLDECEVFLRDLCTPSEIKAMKERWQTASILFNENLSYRDINQKTGASITTIGRVARFLKHESNNGYQIILTRTKEKNNE